MDFKLFAWISVLCTGVCFWLYSDLDRGRMNYEMHKSLYDSQTGTFKRARDVMNLTEIILAPENYINKTNTLERLNHLIQAMNFETPYIFDQHYSDRKLIEQAAGPNVNQTCCGKHLDWLLAQLQPRNQNQALQQPLSDADYGFELLTGRRGLELATLVDTFGKPDSGFYSGNTFWPGSYKLCSSLQMQFDREPTRLGMHYCIARYRHKGWANIRDASYPEARIRLGVCLPETCDTNSYPRFKQQIDHLAKLDMSNHFRESLQLSSVTCLPDERSLLRKIPQSGRIYLAIVLTWCALIILLTLIYELYLRPKHLKQQQQMNQNENYETFEEPDSNLGKMQASQTLNLQLDNNNKQTQLIHNANPPSSQQNHRHSANNWWLELIESLSIRHSLKSFKFDAFRVRHHRGERVRVNLSPLDSIKIIMALLVVLGHSALISIIYARSLRYKIDMSTGNAGNMAMSTVRCVDAYFVFFGVLTSFTLLRKFRPHQLANPFFWLAINFGVFLRVGPIFLLAYWFSRSISPYLSSGPWWDYGFDEMSMKAICMREPWWKSIPYFGNTGIPSVPTCLLPGWFIVCYIQLSLLMPIITYILVNLVSTLKRIGLVLFLSLVSCAALAIRAHQQTAIVPEGISLFGGMAFNLMEKYEPTGYLTSLGRLCSVSVGSLVGCLLHVYDREQIKKWPKWLTSDCVIWLNTFVGVAIVILPLIGHRVYLATGQLPTLRVVVLSSFLTSFLFPIIIGILIVNLATTKNRNVIVRFLGHSFWHIFNRLGLLIFLIHWEILMYGATSFESAPSYGFITDVMKMWAFGSFGSILFAFILYIMIEAPLSRLLVMIAKPWLKNNNNNNNNRTYQNNRDDLKIQNVVVE